MVKVKDTAAVLSDLLGRFNHPMVKVKVVERLLLIIPHTSFNHPMVKVKAPDMLTVITQQRSFNHPMVKVKGVY